MNERIKELAIECYNPYGNFDHEKFAELIVRECAKFMDENSGYNDSDGCWFPEPEAMLTHFGVKE